MHSRNGIVAVILSFLLLIGGALLVATAGLLLAVILGAIFLAYPILALLVRQTCALPDLADEVVYVKTDDGVQLAMHRHRPAAASGQKSMPVVLCHGIGTNKSGVDLDESHSLAFYLKQQGYDVFAVSLRGAGLSQFTPTGPFNFDDHVQRDGPAILKRVIQITGVPAVSWVGYSLGGMIGYALSSSPTTRKSIGCLVTLGSPGKIDHARGWLIEWSARHAWIKRLLPLQPISFLLAPLGGYVHTPIDRMLFNPRIVRRKTVQQLLRHSIEDINQGLIEQLAGWVRNQHEMSMDGTRDYRATLKQIRCPSLFIAGAGDRVAPAHQIRFAHDACRARTKRFVLAGRPGGFMHDYCHIGLAMGEDAPEEIFPLVDQWLKRNGKSPEKRKALR